VYRYLDIILEDFDLGNERDEYLELTSGLVRDLLKGSCTKLFYIYKWKNLTVLFVISTETGYDIVLLKFQHFLMSSKLVETKDTCLFSLGKNDFGKSIIKKNIKLI
jgi:hypothetical protein